MATQILKDKIRRPGLILTEAEYEELTVYTKIKHLEEILDEVGVCRLCGTHYSHDIEEPFANCGCHTTEWSGPLSPYQELEKKIYLAATVKLPPIPMPAILINGVQHFTQTQMSAHASEVFKCVTEYLDFYKKAVHIPTVGERYKHHNGNEYEVVIVSNLDSQRPEYTPTVVYKGDNGKVWSKTLTDFNAKMARVQNEKA